MDGFPDMGGKEPASFFSLPEIPAEFSDESLALRFTAEHGGSLRYVAALGRWYEWTGTVWRQDETLRVFDLARRLCRQASGECEKDRVAAAVASAKTVAAVERLAKADRKHTATIDQWDADPWLLNTPGGVVDLRTGQTRGHRADDYMTKTTAVAPGGECPYGWTSLPRSWRETTSCKLTFSAWRAIA